MSTAPDKAARSSTEIQTNIGQDVNHFVCQIDGLAETLPLANVVVHGTRLMALQENNVFLQTDGIQIKDNGTVNQLKRRSENIKHFLSYRLFDDHPYAGF